MTCCLRRGSGQPKLITIAMSHYCEMARWALSAAGRNYEEAAYLPGFHLFSGAAKARESAAARGGNLGTSKGNNVPLLIEADGTILGDSWAILQACVGEVPEHILTLLNYSVGPQVRTIAYSVQLKDEPEARAGWANAADKVQGVASWQRFIWRWGFSRPVAKAIFAEMVKSEDFVAESRKALEEALDQLDEMVKLDDPAFRRGQDGKPSASAIALACLLMPLASPKDYKPFPVETPPQLLDLLGSVAARPSGRLAVETYALRP